MEAKDGRVEIDRLERGLLLDNGSCGGSEPGDETDNFDEEEPVLYTASFDEAEDNFVNYQTAQWVLYSLLLILAWGIGLFMLLYLPVRRYILRKDFRSRKLYITPNAIVYRVTKPAPFPLGVLKKEKHILLPSVADIVIEQGYLQSHFGVYSIRIENIGIRRPPSDDVQIQGIANPRAFKKAVLMRLSNMRSEAFSRQASNNEDTPNSRLDHLSAASMSPSKSLRRDFPSHHGELVILQKLEEVGSSVKVRRTKLLPPPPPPHTLWTSMFSSFCSQVIYLGLDAESSNSNRRSADSNNRTYRLSYFFAYDSLKFCEKTTS